MSREDYGKTFEFDLTFRGEVIDTYACQAHLGDVVTELWEFKVSGGPQVMPPR